MQRAADGALVAGAFYGPDDVPISIYLRDGGGAEGSQLQRAVEDLADSLGVELLSRDQAIPGSFFRRMMGRVQEPQTMEALKERLDSLERAAEVELVSGPESEANLNDAQALASVIDKIGDDTAAVVQLGSLVIIKTPATAGCSGGVYCKTLTPSQLKRIDDDPDMLRKPEALLSYLAPRVEAPALEARSDLADGS